MTEQVIIFVVLEKVNQNFDEIYTAIGDGTNINGTIKIADDSSTVVTVFLLMVKH